MSPRPSIVALVTLIAIILLLILHQFSGSPSYYRDAFTRGHSLKAWLNDEEERYTSFLQDRQQLITKWGPSEAAVKPWVPPAMLFTSLTTLCTYVLTRRAILRPIFFLHPQQFPFKGGPQILNCTPYVRMRVLKHTNHV